MPITNPKRGRQLGGGSYTLERQRAVVALVRDGMKPSRAAMRCGLTRGAWGYWREQAAAGYEPYATAIAAIEEAETEWERGHLRNVTRIAQSDRADALKASQWALERRFRKEYGDAQPAGVEVKVLAQSSPVPSVERTDAGALAEAIRATLPMLEAEAGDGDGDGQANE